jgi:hypothetical protein
VITFYTIALGQLVGDSFQSPSLPVLARIWLETPGKHLIVSSSTLTHADHHTANTLRHAAYLLCEAGIAGVSDDNITRIVDAWHPYRTSPKKGIIFTYSADQLGTSSITANRTTKSATFECNGAVHLRTYSYQPLYFTSLQD